MIASPRARMADNERVETRDRSAGEAGFVLSVLMDANWDADWDANCVALECGTPVVERELLSINTDCARKSLIPLGGTLGSSKIQLKAPVNTQYSIMTQHPIDP